MKKIALLFISFIATLLVLEIALRFYIPTAKPYLIETGLQYPRQYDPLLGFELIPNINKDGLVTDRSGFRTKIRNIDKECGSRERIILLGDSMLYGFGMNQESIFSEILNNQKNDACFINTGVPGYSTVQEYFMLKNHIGSIKPDSIILFYTQANDMWLNARKNGKNPTFVLSSDELVFDEPENFRPTMLKKSYLYNYIINDVLKGKDLFFIYQKFRFALMKEKSTDWIVTYKVIERMHDLSIEHKTKFIIIDIPTNRQLAEGFKINTRQELLESFCTKTNLEYYNLLYYYPKNYDDIFIENDTHWNEAGHKFISDFINNKVL